MLLPGRKYSAGSHYRYGFNGQEKSDELGEGFTTAEYWEYDSRIGRRWNIDPIKKENESPYACLGNNPIWNIDANGADTIPASKSGDLIGDLQKALGYKKDAQLDLIRIGIKGSMNGIVTIQKQSELNAKMFIDGEIDYKTFNAIREGYNKKIALFESEVEAGMQLLYRNRNDQKYIDVYNSFVSIRNVLVATATFNVATMGVETPIAVTSGFAFTSSNLFSLRGGYGIFGKRGLQIGGYKIEAMYANRVYGTGTILSIKQIGKQGGNFLRWDYGVLHGSQTIGLHSTFRFNLLGKTFGSTKQVPWSAPFKFWKYSQ